MKYGLVGKSNNTNTTTAGRGTSRAEMKQKPPIAR